MKKLRKPEILEIAERDIFYVKSGANNNAAIKNWLPALFVEL